MCISSTGVNILSVTGKFLICTQNAVHVCYVITHRDDTEDMKTIPSVPALESSGVLTILLKLFTSLLKGEKKEKPACDPSLQK